MEREFTASMTCYPSTNVPSISGLNVPSGMAQTDMASHDRSSLHETLWTGRTYDEGAVEKENVTEYFLDSTATGLCDRLSTSRSFLLLAGALPDVPGTAKPKQQP
ncbi:ankyrin repeat protein [Aspergillus luchuensis]|uniref:Ankyrin repeat protein n=1 Tax=Aspergillus kawachii TaxID=1069201 RepID=A0A146FYS9_ASPKA|nr:ankyrin repeat protein [Aspergillus luchuensis]